MANLEEKKRNAANKCKQLVKTRPLLFVAHCFGGLAVVEVGA
jgi:hypothetical protein